MCIYLCFVVEQGHNGGPYLTFLYNVGITLHTSFFRTFFRSSSRINSIQPVHLLFTYINVNINSDFHCKGWQTWQSLVQQLKIVISNRQIISVIETFDVLLLKYTFVSRGIQDIIYCFKMIKGCWASLVALTVPPKPREFHHDWIVTQL